MYYDDVARNIDLYHPGLSKEIESIDKFEYSRFLVTMKNGDIYVYDLDGSKVCKYDPGRNVDEENVQKIFSDRFRYLFSWLHINQKELSEKTGISENTISKYLTGQGMPGFLNLRRLADAFHCSVEEFFKFY